MRPCADYGIELVARRWAVKTLSFKLTPPGRGRLGNSGQLRSGSNRAELRVSKCLPSCRHSSIQSACLTRATSAGIAPPFVADALPVRSSMIRKSGYRFSEKIMLKQKARAG
jgi:hypothetical protein